MLRVLPPAPHNSWRLPRRAIDLSLPRLMAILNITPDSFSDGGRIATTHDAIDAAARALDAGAAILDIGGESTRPGAAPVPEAEQLRRILPVVRAIRAQPGDLGSIPISIDTTRHSVARACLDAGADAINDVSGGAEDPPILTLAAHTGAGLVLMHRVLPPREDSYSDRYATPPIHSDAVESVCNAFRAGILPRALDVGVNPGQIILDPGLGFGKSVEQNLDLIRRTGELIASCDRPVLSGLSRKSFVGRVSLARDSQPAERLAGTLALSLLHVLRGASLLRVHDVPEHAALLRTLAAANDALPNRPRSANPAGSHLAPPAVLS